MKYSNEYMSFLEAHRQVVELKDKLKQVTLVDIEKKLEEAFSGSVLDKHKEVN